VSDESIKYYELLGVAPGASVQELKTAHRDMAKVWHPDRFAHDPRLQQKAQDKLKQINEAYDCLISGKTGRKPRRDASPPGEPSTPTPPVVARARRSRRKSLWLPAAAFVLVFFAASYALIYTIKRQAESRALTDEQSQSLGSEESRGPEGGVKPAAAEPVRNKRGDQPPAAKEVKTSAGAPSTEIEAKNVRAMPTVTLTIDPVTGMLATANCPNKSRMTYPSGMEPGQYCNAHRQPEPPAQGEAPRPKESRLKSFVKRHIL
jgi:hypothetical protein